MSRKKGEEGRVRRRRGFKELANTGKEWKRKEDEDEDEDENENENDDNEREREREGR